MIKDHNNILQRKRNNLFRWNALALRHTLTWTPNEPDHVSTELVLNAREIEGKNKNSLTLSMPLIISDMRYPLSELARVTLAQGSKNAGTAICSREERILKEEIDANDLYMYQLGTAEVDDKERLWPKARAIHFKGGQAAKTGTGEHLPGKELVTKAHFQESISKVYEAMGETRPIGFNLRTNRLEEDIRFALDIGVDYIILDGRDDKIKPIPALVRARAILDQSKDAGHVKLLVVSRLREPGDFIKALALGADGIALVSAALKSVGCTSELRCGSGLCPAGIFTSKLNLMNKNFGKTNDNVNQSEIKARQLTNFLRNANSIMKRYAAACGHSSLAELNPGDLQTSDPEMARLVGLPLTARRRRPIATNNPGVENVYIPSPYKNGNKEQIKRFVQENSFGVLILENKRKTPDIKDAEGDAAKNSPWEEVKVNGKPVIRRTLARHLPFELDVDSNHYNDGNSFESLSAHLATHYPIYNSFDEGQDALLVFRGPQSYISPSWYDNLEAATWNYITVHVYGKIYRLDTLSTIQVMKDRLHARYGSDAESRVYREQMAMVDALEKEIRNGAHPQLRKLIRLQLYKYEQRMRNQNKMNLSLLKERFKYLSTYLGAVRIYVEDFEVDVQAAYKLSQDQTEWSIDNVIAHLQGTGDSDAIAVAREMELHRPYAER